MTWEDFLEAVFGETVESVNGIKAGANPVTAASIYEDTRPWVKFVSYDGNYQLQGSHEPDVPHEVNQGKMVRYVGPGEKYNDVDTRSVNGQSGATITSRKKHRWEVLVFEVDFQVSESNGISQEGTLLLYNESLKVIKNAIANSLDVKYFKPVTFDVAEQIFKAAQEYVVDLKSVLEGLYGRVETNSGGFNGSAAEMLYRALKNLHRVVSDVHSDMGIDSVSLWGFDNGWVGIAAKARDAMEKFLKDVERDAHHYWIQGNRGGKYYPYDMLRRIDESMRGASRVGSVKITVDGVDSTTLNKTWDLTDEKNWIALDRALKDAWKSRVIEFEGKLETHYKNLEKTYYELHEDMQRMGIHTATGGMHEPESTERDPLADSLDNLADFLGKGGGPSGNDDLDLSGRDDGDTNFPDLTDSDENPSSTPGRYGSDYYPGGSGGGGLSGDDTYPSYTDPDYYPGGSGGGGLSGDDTYPSYTDPDYTSPSNSSPQNSFPPYQPPSNTNQPGTVPAKSSGGKGSSWGDDDDDDYVGGGNSSQFPTSVDGMDIGGLSGGSGAGVFPTSGGDYASDSDGSGVLPSMFGDSATGGTAGDSAAANGAGVNGGYPYMPPMGGMGGAAAQQNEKERERKTWLEEDEEVWGADPDCAPAVIGRGAVPDQVTSTPGQPTAPRRPVQPTGPARSTSRSRG